jgi:hypothetical protein
VKAAPAPPQPRLVKEIRERLEALRDRINAGKVRAALVEVTELQGRWTISLTIYFPQPARRQEDEG